MSQIREIANHFLTSRASSGPRRIGFIGTGDTLPISFLATRLALKWAEAGRHLMAVAGEEGGTDLGDLLWEKPLPLLEDEDLHPKRVFPRPGIDLVPFSLTPDRFPKIKPDRLERLKGQEREADLLLVTLPGEAALYLWAPIVRSLHAVALQTSVREKDQEAAYRILRFLFRHNPFLRVHLIPTFFVKEGAQTTASEGVRFHERLSALVDRFQRQALAGPYLMAIEPEFIHAILDRAPFDRRCAPLLPLLERLGRALLDDAPPIERDRFPGFFSSLEAIHADPRDGWQERLDLFDRLDDYLPLDKEVGPKRATLLLNWERRLAVGEAARPGIGEGLVRGLETLAWAHDHLSLLARLYERKVDPALPPHLVLIASAYPDGFLKGAGLAPLPIVFYKATPREGGLQITRVSSPLRRPFSPELSPEEEEALQGSK